LIIADRNRHRDAAILTGNVIATNNRIGIRRSQLLGQTSRKAGAINVKAA
jgi:hypothetical protein